MQATINGSSSTIEHQTQLGDVKYSSTDQSIQLDNNYVNNSSILGTKFRLAYSFKAGYRYLITVTSAELNNTSGFSTGPYLRVDLSNTNSGGGTSCVGPVSINPNYSGNPAAFQYNSTTFQDVQFAFSTALANAFSTLEVSSIPATNGGTNSVRIRKIEIEEIGPDLTVSPTSLATTCGTAVTQTFTVSNPYNVPNITSYEWNLGASSNGWIYNGSAASQNISTSTNSITLTSVCGSIPQNISVAVKQSNTTYRTYTIPVSTNAGPALSISTGDLCSGSKTYSINNLPCNATVTWGTPSPSGVVTHSVNNNQITLGYQSDGNVTLSATVTTTNACTTNLVVNNQNIRVGSPYLQATVNGPDTALANSGYYFSLSTNPWNTSISNINWQVPSGWTISTGQGTKFTTIYTGSSNGDVEVEFYDECGQIWNVYKHVIIGQGGNIIPLNVQPVKTELSIYPNPANNLITVSLSGYSPKTNTNFIKQIRIANKMGSTVLDLKYNDRLKMKQVNISSLKPDIYTIQVYDNKTWHSTKLVKE